MNIGYGGIAVIVIGYMLLVSTGVAFRSRIEGVAVVVLRGHNERAVATLSVAPSLS